MRELLASMLLGGRVPDETSSIAELERVGSVAACRLSLVVLNAMVSVRPPPPFRTFPLR